VRRQEYSAVLHPLECGFASFCKFVRNPVFAVRVACGILRNFLERFEIENDVADVADQVLERLFIETFRFVGAFVTGVGAVCLNNTLFPMEGTQELKNQFLEDPCDD
jgi:hypothetical protein